MRTPPRSNVTVVGRALSPAVTRSGRTGDAFGVGVYVLVHSRARDVWTADRDERDVVETEPDAALRLAEGQSLAAANVGAELAAADVDAHLRRRALEDHPVDRAFEDVVESVGRAVRRQHLDVLWPDIRDDRRPDVERRVVPASEGDAV